MTIKVLSEEIAGDDVHLWLGDDVPSIFIHLSLGQFIHLEEIEVRESHRGLGLTRLSLDAVELHLGGVVVHEGRYTADGMERVAHLFGHSTDYHPEWACSQVETFVADWDQLVPLWPLTG